MSAQYWAALPRGEKERRVTSEQELAELRRELAGVVKQMRKELEIPSHDDYDKGVDYAVRFYAEKFEAILARKPGAQ